jgi:hypothetical protein
MLLISALHKRFWEYQFQWWLVCLALLKGLCINIKELNPLAHLAPSCSV